MGLVAFIIGTILGSFYLVVGTRLPKKENIITSRSKCDHCGHTLAWYELIPIFSYIFLKGHCHYCHKKIKTEHLMLELITGILFMIGYFYFGLTIKYGIYLVLISEVLIIFISDFKYMIILDSPLIIGGILIAIIRYFEVGFFNTLYSCLSGIFLFLVMYLIKIFGDFVFKKESLGGGDIKLCLLIGFALGYPHIGMRLSLISMFFSAFLALPYALGTVYFHKKNELPFGPFLISSAVIVFIFLEKFRNLLVFFTL